METGQNGEKQKNQADGNGIWFLFRLQKLLGQKDGKSVVSYPLMRYKQ